MSVLYYYTDGCRGCLFSFFATHAFECLALNLSSEFPNRAVLKCLSSQIPTPTQSAGVFQKIFTVYRIELSYFP